MESKQISIQDTIALIRYYRSIDAGALKGLKIIGHDSAGEVVTVSDLVSRLCRELDKLALGCSPIPPQYWTAEDEARQRAGKEQRAKRAAKKAGGQRGQPRAQQRSDPPYVTRPYTGQGNNYSNMAGDNAR